jgi:uncharacterized membrane protein
MDGAKRLSFNDRAAVAITRAVGSMPMFYALVGWYAGWIGLNLALGPHAFDHPWAFAELLFLSNFLQLVWLPILSVGQNVMNRYAEARAEEQFRLTAQINRFADEIRTVQQVQQAMLDTLITLSEQTITVLHAVDDKAQEIDAEIDAWTARETGEEAESCSC